MPDYCCKDFEEAVERGWVSPPCLDKDSGSVCYDYEINYHLWSDVLCGKLIRYCPFCGKKKQINIPTKKRDYFHETVEPET